MAESTEESAKTPQDGKNSLILEVLGHNRFDDRLDVQTDVKPREAISLLARSVVLLFSERRLLLAKFLLQLLLVFPVLLLPWLAKITADHGILGKPLSDADVYPPFMMPILEAIQGQDRVGIVLIVSIIAIVLLLLFGVRAGGTSANLLQGQDAATQSENAISQGYSRGGGFFGILEYLVHVRLTQAVTNRLRTRLFDRLSRLPMSVVDEQRIGDSLFRVLYDAPAAPDLAFRLTVEPFFMGLAAFINLYLLEYSYGRTAPELIVVAWLMVPVAFLAGYPFYGALRRTNQNKRAAGAATTNAIEESLTQVGAVQALGAQEQEQERFAKRSAHAFLRERYAWAVIIAAATVAGGAFGAATIYVTIVVTDQVIAGNMTPGDFPVLLGMYGQIAIASGYFGMIWIKLQETLAATRRAFFFLDYVSEADEAEGATFEGAESLRFENVGFDYPGGVTALRSITLECHAGQVLALVGPTGAGKTTLAYLIPKFLTPTAGRVTFDERAADEFAIDSLRQQVTYVFQEHQLLSTTIRDNLAFANPDASETDMREALAMAGATEFVDALPDGLDTRIGRGGDTLSVGQQQRLSIARGLVRGGKVLILDEPTAALDPQTEAQLVASLRSAAKGRIVVVIAHRLSTIRHADRIAFLEDGELKEVGTHDELMALDGGAYHEFVRLQTQASAARG